MEQNLHFQKVYSVRKYIIEKNPGPGRLVCINPNKFVRERQKLARSSAGVIETEAFDGGGDMDSARFMRKNTYHKLERC